MREEPVFRARVIQHFVENGMRESYASEKARLAAERDRPDAGTVSDFFQYRQGGGKS